MTAPHPLVTDIGTEAAEPWFRFGPMPLTPILEAALASFLERGYHGASVRDIAGRVGVTVPTLYYHYGSKQGLLLTLLETSIDDLMHRTDVAARTAGDDPVDRFAALVACIVLYTCYRPSISWLDAEARYLDESAREQYAAPRERLERRFLEVLLAGRAAGFFRVDDPELRLRALFGALQSVAVWYRPDGKLSPEDVAVQHVGFALDALGTSPDRAARARRHLQELLDGTASE
jgi:TetR/AcrR family transcriptional regulator, cholesterol catabolism regulator